MHDRRLCIRVESGISDFLDGALPTRARYRFEAHLRGCRACRIQLQRMRRTLDLLSELPGEEMPAWMKLRLDPQLRNPLRPPPSSLHRRSPTAPCTRAPDL